MPNPSDCLDHVVVLMMENRSFDNMLGYLPSPIDGVAGKQLSNPVPVRWDGQPVDGADQGPVFVSPGEVMDNPNPDPGEYFPHVNTQLYNVVSPTSNAYLNDPTSFQPPYNQPDPLPATAPMNGFVQDYYDNFQATQGRAATREEYSVIMNCFPTSAVPVISGLAQNFAVFDQWFCAVPSQTFCNRSFFHAAISNGQVTNAPFEKWLENDNPTLFDSLEEKGISWLVYYDPEDVFPLTLLIHFPKLWPYWLTHFRIMDCFYEDAANGNLPSYAFIEPRLFLNHNDEHPPIQILGVTQPSTVTAGEQLINDVYNAIRTSGAKTGSNYANTLLAITYDEHGGCFDHVPPVSAKPPQSGAPAGQMDFTFDRLGIRVPMVMVSTWTTPFNVVSTQMDHCSMLRTLQVSWGLEPLTLRDAASPTFHQEVFNSPTPRSNTEWPVLTPPTQPEGVSHNLAHPLNDLQKAIVGTVNHVDRMPQPINLDTMTVGEALAFMRQKRAAMEAL